ncbi:SDR family NAD(P)-dependent oxidoreductase, partial [Salmonella enterica subsp. enterica serovar Enteritidis]
LAGLVGPGRHPGRLFCGKNAPGGQHGVKLVDLEVVVGAITLLLNAPKGGDIYNICARAHPARTVFYPHMPRLRGLAPPNFLNPPDNANGNFIDGSRI